MKPAGANRFDAGFSLVEMMIAALLLATSLTAVAELFAIAVRNNAVARNSTVCAVLAAQKIQELRGDPLQLNDGRHLDDQDPFIRQWTVEPVPASPMVVVDVLVTRRRDRDATDPGSSTRAPEEARLTTIMRRVR